MPQDAKPPAFEELDAAPHPLTRRSGYVLGATAVLMAVFILMHPTTDAHSITEFREGLQRIRMQNAVVHGSLVAIQVCVVAGLLGLCDLLGMKRPAVRIALLAYVLGTLAECGAALINGFIVPDLLIHNRVHEGAADAMRPVLSLCHHGSMVFAKGGVIAMSCAVLIWSADLLRIKGGRLAAIVGILCAGGALLAQATGHMSMSVHGFGAFVISQSMWYGTVAWRLIRG